MLDRKVTPTMIATAEVLLARSARWSRGAARTTDGQLVNVVYFSSSRVKKNGATVVHITRVDGAACSCESFTYRQACAHAVATRMESERAREAAARKPMSTYDRLFPADEHGTVSAF